MVREWARKWKRGSEQERARESKRAKEREQVRAKEGTKREKEAEHGLGLLFVDSATEDMRHTLQQKQTEEREERHLHVGITKRGESRTKVLSIKPPQPVPTSEYWLSQREEGGWEEKEKEMQQREAIRKERRKRMRDIESGPSSPVARAMWGISKCVCRGANKSTDLHRRTKADGAGCALEAAYTHWADAVCFGHDNNAEKPWDRRARTHTRAQTHTDHAIYQSFMLKSWCPLRWHRTVRHSPPLSLWGASACWQAGESASIIRLLLRCVWKHTGL